MNKRAVILAGGKGTRLRPYTVVLPKPLMPIGEYPILEVIIRQLAAHGFSHITLAVNHQAELIKAFFGDGSKWNIKVDYSLEQKALSTIGPLGLIDDLPDTFLLMNGDILTDLNFSEFYENHNKSGHIFTICSHKRTHRIDYGVLETNKSNQLTGFIEKPTKEFLVSMGIYMMKKDILSYVPHDTPYGFDNLMLDLLKEGKHVEVNEFDGYWLDIGRPDDYMIAIEEFSKMKDVLFNG